MKYINLGNTGIKISGITFGAWAIGGWMWGGSDEDDAVHAIQTAFDLGMTTIDTAAVYGFGKSEELVGKAVKGRRDKTQILTKYGLRWNTSNGTFYFNSKDEKGRKVEIRKYAGKASVIAECEESLKRLQTDYIDLYQIHWPDPSTPIEETMEGILKLREQGKIRAAGVSNYNAEQMKEANAVVDIITNQVPYSMVLRDIEKDIVPYCQETGKGILAYSPLQRGILTGKITSDYKFREGDHRPDTPYYKEPNLSRINNLLDMIRPLADENGLTLAQLVIYWTLQQPSIWATLVGARNPGQVEENIKAGEIDLDNSVIEEINDKLTGLNIDIDP